MVETGAKARDGRTVRGERTRAALVDALLALLDEGRLRPTSAEIAERAGVSERSVFQHFQDREALFEATAHAQYQRVVPTLQPVDVTLALPQRIDHFTEQRCRLYQQLSGVRRAALLLEPESDAVAGWLAATRRAKARELERVFRAELQAVPDQDRPAVRAAAVAACAWTAWEALSFHQGLSPDASRQAMRTALAALLAPR